METFLRLFGSLLSLYTTVSTVSSSSAICRCCPVPSTSSTFPKSASALGNRSAHAKYARPTKPYGDPSKTSGLRYRWEAPSRSGRTAPPTSGRRAAGIETSEQAGYTLSTAHPGSPGRPWRRTELSTKRPNRRPRTDRRPINPHRLETASYFDGEPFKPALEAACWQPKPGEPG